MIQHSSGQTNAKDETAIKEILTNFSGAWNRHDAKRFSVIFSDNADFTNVMGQSFHGSAEIEKHHAPVFATKFKTSYVNITQSKIRFIKPGVVAVDAWWEMTGIQDAAGKDISETGLMNFIAIKDNGKWFIDVLHNMGLHQ
jgi:uncharacterized protein (TIGR02246 family)